MRKVKQWILYLTIISVLFTSICTSLAATEVLIQPVMTDSANERPQPRYPIKEWVYAFFNGVLYKRLWNYTTGEWETGWILET